jgi:hypothetical protein
MGCGIEASANGSEQVLGAACPHKSRTLQQGQVQNEEDAKQRLVTEQYAASMG